MQIRDLEISDYHLKYCELIQHAFQKDFKYIQYLDFKNFVNGLNKHHFIKVIEDDEPLEYESGESGSMFDASISLLIT